MKKIFKNIAIYLIPIAIFAGILTYFNKNLSSTKDLTINEFIKYVQEDRIEDMTSQGSVIYGKLKDEDKTDYELYLPDEFRVSLYDNYLKEPIESGQIKYTGKETPKTPWILSAMPIILMMISIGFIWYMFIAQSQGGGGGKVMNFGKSRAKLNKPDGEIVTFADVAGLKEEKQELKEVVDFLKNPKKYVNLGARIPKGILLVGPPGTGKTYLSRAVAGEAKVPFYSISGSDFVEMFVGVGASRVRDLFTEAKKNAPSIVFIDEIDAVGRRRGAGMGGGHDEREQTLNQLLVEMDGFGKNEGVIVMAATNRPDILDPAILRPGRFDREIFVGLPDVREREEMLLVHTRNKKLDPDVDLKVIAKTTAGFSPADLENLCNEAAILTARNNLDSIPRWIFEEAAIKVVAGPEKKSAVVVEKERVLTAYHEAGHAIVSRSLPDMDTVHMITIIPRGRAGGFTAYLPKEDSMYNTKNGMKHRLIELLGGRAAEAIVLDDISTGASNDIERATKIARAMITQYGMSDKLGPMAYESDDEVFMGKDLGKTKNYSEEVAAEIDKEMQDMLNEAYIQAKNLLTNNIDLLHTLAKELLDKETIDAQEFEILYQRHLEKQNKNGVEPPEELERVQETEKIIEKTLKKDEDYKKDDNLKTE